MTPPLWPQYPHLNRALLTNAGSVVPRNHHARSKRPPSSNCNCRHRCPNITLAGLRALFCRQQPVFRVRLRHHSPCINRPPCPTSITNQPSTPYSVSRILFTTEHHGFLLLGGEGCYSFIWGKEQLRPDSKSRDPQFFRFLEHVRIESAVVFLICFIVIIQPWRASCTSEHIKTISKIPFFEERYELLFFYLYPFI